MFYVLCFVLKSCYLANLVLHFLLFATMDDDDDDDNDDDDDDDDDDGDDDGDDDDLCMTG